MVHHDTTSSYLSALDSRWTGCAPVIALSASGLIGLLAAIAGAFASEQGYRRFMLAWLVAFAFVLSLSLGGLFFVIMQHLTRAGWSVLVRRIPEAMSANMLVLALLFIPIAVSVLRGDGAIYPWSSHHVSEPAGQGPSHELSPGKQAWLSPTAFVIRWAVLLAIWAALGRYFWRNSLRQDADDADAATTRMERFAGPAALILGLTLTLGAFDLLMSLDPHWYSTMFGIYYFSGAAVGALAIIILLAIFLQRAGMLTRAIGEAHYLDLGRLLFGFLFFWGYIAFSQYMLLWYANLPETTSWLRIRGMTTVPGDVNAWSAVALVLLFGHFLIPFAALMSRHVKRRPALLALGAAWMLAMHYLDLLWVVMPQLGPNLYLGVVEIGLLLALGSAYLLGVWWLLRGRSLVPLKDPRLAESVAHETVY